MKLKSFQAQPKPKYIAGGPTTIFPSHKSFILHVSQTNFHSTPIFCYPQFLNQQFWASHISAPACFLIIIIVSFKKNAARYLEHFQSIIFSHFCKLGILADTNDILTESQDIKKEIKLSQNLRPLNSNIKETTIIFSVNSRYFIIVVSQSSRRIRSDNLYLFLESVEPGETEYLIK